MLSFNRWQKANLVRCREAFNHDVTGWNLLEWAGAAAGEMGEVANVCKKIRRKELNVGGKWAQKDPSSSELKTALADEIGDTLAYLSLLASAAGLDLGECAARKFDAVSEQAGWKGERLLMSCPKCGEEVGDVGGGNMACLACGYPPEELLPQLTQEERLACDAFDLSRVTGKPSAPALPDSIPCIEHKSGRLELRHEMTCENCEKLKEQLDAAEWDRDEAESAVSRYEKAVDALESRALAAESALERAREVADKCPLAVSHDMPCAALTQPSAPDEKGE